MKSAFIIIFALLVAALGGCRNNVTSEDFEKYPVQTEAIEEDLPHIPEVRTGGVVRAYRVGRTVDRADPRIMHEAHWIYRVEQDPTFIVHTEDKVVLEPSTQPDPNYAPVLLRQELASELVRQRSINRALQDAVTQTQEQTQSLLRQTQEMSQLMLEMARERNDAARGTDTAPAPAGATDPAPTTAPESRYEDEEPVTFNGEG